MIADELPLWASPKTVLREQSQTAEDVQTTITARIASLLGYTPTNEWFIKFVDEFGHPNQLRHEPDDPSVYHTQLRDWENMFTHSFYRAAVIAAKKLKASTPSSFGIDMERVIAEAEQLIRNEAEDQERPFQGLGYK